MDLYHSVNQIWAPHGVLIFMDCGSDVIHGFGHSVYKNGGYVYIKKTGKGIA